MASDALIEIHDTTNDRYAVTQVTMIHDSVTPYFTEFGYMDNFSPNVTSFSGIGTIGVGYSSASGGDLELRLTPPANTAITTKVFQYNFYRDWNWWCWICYFYRLTIKDSRWIIYWN